MTLRTERIRTLDQIRAFLDGSEPTDFRFAGRDSAYDFVRRTLVRFEFHGLKRDEKGLVKRFIEKVTGYSRAQITRLVKQHRRTGGDPRPPQEASRQALSAPLHPLRRGPARRGRRGLRPALWTRHQGGPVAHVPCLRRPAPR